MNNKLKALASVLSAKGLRTQANLVQSLTALIKTAGGPGSPSGDTQGEKLLYKALQAYYNWVVVNDWRNYYEGDDAECAQTVIDAVLEAFRKGKYGPGFPKQLLMAGLFAEDCAEATGFGDGDEWDGLNSFFKGHLEVGVGRGSGAFSGRRGNGQAMGWWKLFIEENEIAYKKEAEELERTSKAPSLDPKDSKETEGPQAKLSPKNILTLDSRGKAVVRLQKALIAAGFDLPKHGVDGHFGAETKAAVLAFKRKALADGKYEGLSNEGVTPDIIGLIEAYNKANRFNAPEDEDSEASESSKAHRFNAPESEASESSEKKSRFNDP
jgi:hypothetical protein